MVPRRMQEGYGPPSPRVDAHSSRLPPPPSRRTSDHETVLPSVERETVDLNASPRTASNHRPDPDQYDMPREFDNAQSSKHMDYPPAPRSYVDPYGPSARRREPALREQETYPSQVTRQSAMHPHRQEYLPMEPRSRHRAHPSQETIDLTTSPLRPSIGSANGLYSASQKYPAQFLERHNPMSVRNDYRERPAEARSHAYISENDRMYERRRPPAHEYIPLRR